VNGNRFEMEIFQAARRIRSVIAVAFLTALTLATAGPASAEGSTSFGLKPARSGTGYFTYSLERGESVSDEIVATNQGESNVTLKLYTLDARTATNGGVIFPGGEGSPKIGSGAWISLSISRVTLEPGASVTIPFTFTVPSDARIGEHVAGIVAQNAEATTGTAQDGQFVVQLVQRAAVPIWETVPGPAVTDLQVASITHVVEGGSSSFDVRLSNAGNTSIDGADGGLKVQDRTGASIGALPIRITGKFLAADTVVYPVRFDDLLPPGEYSVAVSIDFGGPRPATREYDFSVLKEEASSAPEPLNRGFTLPTRVASTEEPGQQAARDTVPSAAVTLVVLLVSAVFVWSLLRRKSPGTSKTPQQ